MDTSEVNHASTVVFKANTRCDTITRQIDSFLGKKRLNLKPSKTRINALRLKTSNDVGYWTKKDKLMDEQQIFPSCPRDAFIILGDANEPRCGCRAY